MRASELKKKNAFHTIKVIFSTCFCRFSKILNFLQFPGIFSFPGNKLDKSGFPGMREISLKVETLLKCQETVEKIDNVRVLRNDHRLNQF